MNTFLYQIAGHTVALSFSAKDIDEDALGNYAPFRVKKGADKTLFLLSVIADLPTAENYAPVGRFDDDIASIGVFKSAAGNFRFRITAPGSTAHCTMDVAACFSEARVQLPDDKRFRLFSLNNCLMLLYAFATAKEDTLLMHASVIKRHGEGFVFLGKSGTGKSTHSRLWLEHVDGSELLNDDNPVLRILDGQAYVFGTPWSGKTPCYKNDRAPLAAIVKLRQAPENRLKKLSSLQAYATVLPACSCMRWEDDLMTGVHRTIEKLIAHTGCFQLDCLPDKAAVAVCAAIKERT